MKSPTLRWKFLLFALPVVMLFAWALNFDLGVYAISPGQAINVARLISVRGTSSRFPPGAIEMTDVSLARVTPIVWLIDQFNSTVSLVPASEIIGSASQSQFDSSQLSQMADAKVAAAVAALRYLHRSVPIRNGAEILEVLPGTPAFGLLRAGDLIYAVNGMQTPSGAAFQATISELAPHTVVTLSILREVDTSRGISAQQSKVVVRLASNPRMRSHAFLGVEFTQGTFYVLPISLKIATGDIGGPSAGLAFTLGLIEKLSGMNLTHGKVVAATGTIDALGHVGDVGGVAQKTISVKRGGAKIFFVPIQEYAVAKAKAGANLRVYGVSSLTQVLSILNKLAA